MSSTVLFLDDEPFRMAPFVEALGNAGYRVIMATDAAGAVELAKEHRDEISVLVVDIMIPTGTEEAEDIDPRRAGLWALDQIRTIPELAEVPAIVLSAVSRQRVAEAAEALGVVEYLEKPKTFERLVMAVDNAVGKLREGGRD